MENPLCPCHSIPMKKIDREEGGHFWGCISNKWAVYTDESLEEERRDKERFNNQMNALHKQLDAFAAKYGEKVNNVREVSDHHTNMD